MRRTVVAEALLVLWAATGAGACRRGQDPTPSAGARPAGGGGRRALKFPVQAEPVAAKTVEYAVNAVGSIEAFETVQVTARVQGVVERVRFAEGERVGTGKVLVEIEPRRFKLAVDAARAGLEKAKANRLGAENGLNRREQAVAATPGIIPGDEIAQFRTRVRTSEAETSEMEAAVAQAELNLRDAYVRTPIGGIIETRKVQTGQYVQPGTVLATLVRRDPMLLRFQVPAAEAAALRPGMTARFQLRDEPRTHDSRITHVSQAADSTSRMVAITAEIDGPDRNDLRPGAFAEVVIPVGTKREAPVIPQTAVRPTERGFVAYVVEGAVAKERILTLGLRTADGLVEVKSGLRPGEKVVVRGAEALREGAAVEVEKAGGRKGEGKGEGKGDVAKGSRPSPGASAEKLGP
jgi:RND family efflux transporter MFP subunit